MVQLEARSSIIIQISSKPSCLSACMPTSCLSVCLRVCWSAFVVIRLYSDMFVYMCLCLGIIGFSMPSWMPYLRMKVRLWKSNCLPAIHMDVVTATFLPYAYRADLIAMARKVLPVPSRKYEMRETCHIHITIHWYRHLLSAVWDLLTRM